MGQGTVETNIWTVQGIEWQYRCIKACAFQMECERVGWRCGVRSEWGADGPSFMRRETNESGLTVRTCKEKFTCKPKGLTIGHLCCRTTNVLLECCSDAKEN